ncbi:CoA pyrophosphatase [Arthrobacter sp. ISL-48]|uniref:NUDIX hydrolase n=1 Tax=Arthrobacter sp. ISL-48 TaxID=2819110 RepID=UPI001BEA09A3|nr:CoA pyrophosphatase [Arthrobacter sp. ISL-48]MBT2532330.1 CoA pyrophosphatase [Arthrobacter sp. ISL-48]
MSARQDLIDLAHRTESGDSTKPDTLWAGLTVDESIARRAAVLMLFGVLDDVPASSGKALAPADLDVLLLERAHTLGSHPGQVAFPGGGIDLEESPVAAALREAEEETGLDSAGVEVLGALQELGLAHSNFLVTPVLAWWASPSPVRVVDYGESAQVFRIPVRDLLDPDNRVTATISRAGRTFNSPAFTVNGVLVWGFTGIVLDGLFEQLGWAVPWDRHRLHPVAV